MPAWICGKIFDAMKEGDIRFIKLLILVNGLVPLALLVWDQSHNRLGANPQNFLILTTGMMALIFLILTMAVTPARKVLGWNWAIQFRRMLGLYAFFYACLHFLCFFSLDRGFSVSGTLAEVLKRKYIWFGMTALLVMVPLAITSTNGMIKRLGGKRWRALHRLAYVAAIAGVIHFYMQVKADVRKPLVFATVLAVLLGWRLMEYFRNRKPKPAPAPAPAPK
jgi:sulfoxide reductase heme-binding subunit YedZ